VLLAVAATVAACSEGGEIREWQPGDHDQANNQAPQVSARAAPPGAPGATGGVDPGLIDLAWRRNCEKCHGARGRGDGPEGPMVRAPDLTRPEWLEKTSDAQMLEVIRNGKNKMPGFGAALPANVLEGLVTRIRSGGGAAAKPAGGR
jgi:cytochrome c oxidase cbb3-type subunit 3